MSESDPNCHHFERHSLQPPDGVLRDPRFLGSSTVDPTPAAHHDSNSDVQEDHLSPLNKANQVFYAKRKSQLCQIHDHKQWPDEEHHDLSSRPFGEKRGRSPEVSTSSKRPRGDGYFWPGVLTNSVRSQSVGYGDPEVHLSPRASNPIYNEGTRHSRAQSVQKSASGKFQMRSHRAAPSPIGAEYSMPSIDTYRIRHTSAAESSSGYSSPGGFLMSPPSRSRSQMRNHYHYGNNRPQRDQTPTRFRRARTIGPLSHPIRGINERAAIVSTEFSPHYGQDNIPNLVSRLGSPIYLSDGRQVQGYDLSSGSEEPGPQTHAVSRRATLDAPGNIATWNQEMKLSMSPGRGENIRSDPISVRDQAQPSHLITGYINVDDDDIGTLEQTLGRSRKKFQVQPYIPGKTADIVHYSSPIAFDLGRRQKKRTPEPIDEAVSNTINSIEEELNMRTPDHLKRTAVEVIDLLTPTTHSNREKGSVNVKDAVKTAATGKRKRVTEIDNEKEAEKLKMAKQWEAAEKINLLKRQGERKRTQDHLFDEEVEDEEVKARRLKLIQEEAKKKNEQIEISIVQRHAASMEQELSEVRKKAAAADAQRISKEVNDKKAEMRAVVNDQLRQQEIARLEEKQFKAAKLLNDMQNERRARDAQRDEEDRQAALLEAEMHKKLREQREVAKKTALALKPAKMTNKRTLEEVPALPVEQGQSCSLPTSTDMFVGEDEQIPRNEISSIQPINAVDEKDRQNVDPISSLVGNNASSDSVPIAIVATDGRRKTPAPRSRSVSRAASRPVDAAQINAVKQRGKKWTGQRGAELELKKQNVLDEEQRKLEFSNFNDLTTGFRNLNKAFEGLQKQMTTDRKEQQKAAAADRKKNEQLESMISKLTAVVKTTGREKPVEPNAQWGRLSHTFGGLASGQPNNSSETRFKLQAETEARERAATEEMRRTENEKKERNRARKRELYVINYRKKQEAKLKADISTCRTEEQIGEELDVLEAEFRKAQLERMQKKDNRSPENGIVPTTIAPQLLDSDYDDDNDDSPEAQTRKAQRARVRHQIYKLKTFNQTCSSFARAASTRSATIGYQTESEESEEDPEDGEPNPGAHDTLNPEDSSVEMETPVPSTSHAELADPQISSQPSSGAPRHISLGLPDTEMIYVYSVQRLSEVGGVASKPVIINLFLDREEANRFANDELLKVRWGAANDIQALSIELEGGLYSGRATIDEKERIFENVDVLRLPKFAGDLENFQIRHVKGVFEPHSYLVSEIITRRIAVSVGPEGDVDMGDSDDETAITPSTLASSNRSKVPMLQQSRRIVGQYTDRYLANTRASQHFLRLVAPVGGSIDDLVFYHNEEVKTVRAFAETLDDDLDDVALFQAEKPTGDHGAKMQVVVERLEVQGPRN